jgi:hypothetical protein
MCTVFCAYVLCMFCPYVLFYPYLLCIYPHVLCVICTYVLCFTHMPCVFCSYVLCILPILPMCAACFSNIFSEYYPYVLCVICAYVLCFTHMPCVFCSYVLCILPMCTVLYPYVCCLRICCLLCPYVPCFTHSTVCLTHLCFMFYTYVLCFRQFSNADFSQMMSLRIYELHELTLFSDVKPWLDVTVLEDLAVSIFRVETLVNTRFIAHNSIISHPTCTRLYSCVMLVRYFPCSNICIYNSQSRVIKKSLST